MAIHFGIFQDWGNYESPLIGCEETLCGCTGEIPTGNSVNNWKYVTCKKCLKLREAYELGVIEDEKNIVKQMGEMAEFFSKNDSGL